MLPIVYSPDYVTPLPPEHRFPMPKFGRVYQVLIQDGIAHLDQFHVAQAAPDDWLTRVHTPDYVRAYRTGTLDRRAMRRIGFPWSPALVTRTVTAVGGTVLTARLALEHGLACNTAGGTHHAHADFGAGFCIFNDLAVAAQVMLDEGLAKQVLIVDLDVHQGDGTAAIFQDNPQVFTFSMHCEKNFPFRKVAGDLDVGMPTATGDGGYLALLDHHLPRLLDDVRPDLVLYDAGVDPHHGDRLGKLALTDAGLFRRDHFVLAQCAQRGIPAATVIGGGYGRDITALARRHATVHRAASQVWDDLNLGQR